MTVWIYTDIYLLYICVRFELKFSTGQVAPKPDSPVQNRTVLTTLFMLHAGDRLRMHCSRTLIMEVRELFLVVLHYVPACCLWRRP